MSDKRKGVNAVVAAAKALKLQNDGYHYQMAKHELGEVELHTKLSEQVLEKGSCKSYTEATRIAADIIDQYDRVLAGDTPFKKIREDYEAENREILWFPGPFKA